LTSASLPSQTAKKETEIARKKEAVGGRQPPQTGKGGEGCGGTAVRNNEVKKP